MFKTPEFVTTVSVSLGQPIAINFISRSRVVLAALAALTLASCQVQELNLLQKSIVPEAAKFGVNVDKNISATLLATDRNKYTYRSIKISEILQGSKELKRGDVSELIVSLSIALGAEPSDRLDATLVSDMKKFQKNHSVPISGKLDQATIKKLCEEKKLVCYLKEKDLLFTAEFFQDLSLPEKLKITEYFLFNTKNPHYRYILEQSLVFSGCYEPFVNDLILELQDPNISSTLLDPVAKQRLSDYLKLISKALSYGIYHSLTLEEAVLSELIASYEKTSKTQPLGLIILGSDFNGAFYGQQVSTAVSFMIENGIAPRILSCFSETELLSHLEIQQALHNSKSAFSLVCLHGQPDRMKLGISEDQKFYWDASDRQVWKKFTEQHKAGAVVLLYSCNTGSTGAPVYDMALSMAPKLEIIAPVSSAGMKLQINEEYQSPRAFQIKLPKGEAILNGLFISEEGSEQVVIRRNAPFE